MQIIKPSEKDTFDKIYDNLKKNEEERQKLILAILTYNNFLDAAGGLNDKNREFVSVLNQYISEAMEINNKEVDILKRMLHYLQLLKFNECYGKYVSSYFYDYFEELLNFINDNRLARLGKDVLMIASVSMGITHNASKVSVLGDIPIFDNMLTDEIYEEIVAKIPRR